MRSDVKRLILPHLLLLALLYAVVLLPDRRPNVQSCAAMLAGIGMIEALFLAVVFRARQRGKESGAFDIMVLVWTLLLIWELAASVYHVAHPVLIPAPENVFHTFREQWRIMLLNVGYSMGLLVSGVLIGLTAAVALGLPCGWIPRLRRFAYPIANVMAPIPPVVISPYLVALMPSFRSASMLVIVLGVFWPTFLTTVNRVNSIDPQILDAARTLVPSTGVMIFRILLPYVFPGIVSGLKVSMTTSLLMLNFAELMGATHGMGYYVQNSITYANYAHAVAGIFVIGAVVTALSAAVTWLQGRLIRWE